jgi:hypothetical protein
MIVTELYNGQGLGNQIWNIVALKIIANKFNYSYGVNSLKGFKGDRFLKNIDFGVNVTSGTSPEGGPPILLPKGINHYYKEPTIRYPSYMGGEDCSPVDLYFWNELKDNTKIDGIFQKISYIEESKKEISEWLKPESIINDYCDDDICVINFRGNDYLHTTAWLPPEYYSYAINKMLKINKKMKFVIVTDDPHNARKSIPVGDIVGVFFELPQDSSQIKQEKIALDYSIIYNAVNIILSASTFCFWPAWTNKIAKNIIAPKYWFDYKISNGWWRPDSSIVEDWIYIDNNGNSFSGLHCKKEYSIYKNNNSFYLERGIA